MADTSEARLYFAYGSNLSTAQMRDRCPASAPVALSHLPGWTWIINERGYANIVRNSPSTTTSTTSAEPPTDHHRNNNSKNSNSLTAAPQPGVYGLLYRLDPSDEPTLDVCEGVPWAYERASVDVVLLSPSPSTFPPAPAESSRVPGEADGDGDGSGSGRGNVRRALAYVDYKRVGPGRPKPEYVGRMNRGVAEAEAEWGLPRGWVDEVVRGFVPVVRGEGEGREKGEV